jgi:thiopeptide-type bacteriocin biosynthesis protein
MMPRPGPQKYQFISISDPYFICITTKTQEGNRVLKANHDLCTMQQWLSYHLYPLETPDVFLARAVRPFLETTVWPVKGTRAFFIRYEDEKGPHIRLRIRAEADWMEDTLRPVLEGWFADRGEMIASVYTPEPDRFGGPEGLLWAEEHFHVSTRVVLDRLNRPYTYGDALFDALRLQTILAYGAGFSREKAGWYFQKLAALWTPAFFKSEQDLPEAALQEEVFSHFEGVLKPQEAALRGAIDALWKALDKTDFDNTQTEWVRWLRGNQLILPEFGDQLEKALPSLIHFTNNRIGLTNPDEVYVSYILGKIIPV